MSSAAPVLPKFNELMWPTLEALRRLGNSGTVHEIEAQVYEIEEYSAEQQGVIHGDGPQTEIAYRLAWSRTYLKRVGAVENSKRAVWTITDYGLSLTEDDTATVPSRVRAQLRAMPTQHTTAESEATESGDIIVEWEQQTWQEKLIEVLLGLEPAAFERLSQRLLREQGFVSVMVTGRSGDGGIDGTGILRMKLLSFQMFFQCKKYRGNVGASAIRDFRGAMVGRSDKGLLITTGRFTAEAMKEANRDGAPPIDLVDGEQLCVMLKELGLGVATELVEQVTLDPDWFRSV